MACAECPHCGWMGNKTKCPECGAQCTFDENPWDHADPDPDEIDDQGDF